MAFSYLSDDELRDVRDSIQQTLGYSISTRMALLGGMERRYAGGLPGYNSPETIGLTLDLRALNEQPRLTNGSVPLKIFLLNALDLGGEAGTLDRVRTVLNQIDVHTSGASKIDTDSLPETQEKILFRDEMMPWSFMNEGVKAGRSVAKLQVTRYEEGHQVLDGADPVVHLGTGWLMGPSLLVTNHHVLNARNSGEAAANESDLKLQSGHTVVTFDFDGENVQGSSVALTELLAWSKALDYAIARIDANGRSPLRLRNDDFAADAKPPTMSLNIIQHPEGRSKRFAIRNNLLTSITDTDIRYFTDTMGGSSGSPVCDDQWRAVALHRGSASVSGVSYLGKRVAFVNIGTKIRTILADLEKRFPPVYAALASVD